jgi:hypothetical protein
MLLGRNGGRGAGLSLCSAVGADRGQQDIHLWCEAHASQSSEILAGDLARVKRWPDRGSR